MDGSILNDIKKMLGLSADYTAFDQELIIFVNSVLGTLFQIGVGSEPYSITGAEETWADYLGGTPYMSALESVKSYVFLKVRVLFDPPASSTILQAFNDAAKEYEWRIYITANPAPVIDWDSQEEEDEDDDYYDWE